MGVVSRLLLKCFPVPVVCTMREGVAWNILVIVPKFPKSSYTALEEQSSTLGPKL